MTSTIKAAIIFSIGAAVGSCTAWYFAKRVYEQIAQEEIDSVKESLRKTIKKDSEKIPPTEKEREEYGETLKKTGYVSDEGNAGIGLVKNEQHENASLEPYIITPDEFGEYEDYEQINLTLYSDGILADDNDVKINDVDNLVGNENLDRIGEYEDDALHVRNDRLRVDYEILVDYRAYDEVLKLNPHLSTEG